MKLDAAQRAVVESKANLRVVVAGPGSGKTTVLVAAVAAEMATVHPQRIVVVTYTVAAAAQLKQRLAEAGRDPSKLGYVGTLHALIFKLLRQRPGMAGATIIDEGQADDMLKGIAESMGFKLTGPELSVPAIRNPQGRAGLAVKELLFRLKRDKMFTFDMLLGEGLKLCKDAEYKWPFDSVFVDEYQDASEADAEIYQAMHCNRKFVVGDPDQAIYNFRGGEITGIIDLIDSEDWEKHTLEANYRSTFPICEKANMVIAHNDLRVPKQTLPFNQSQDGGVMARRCDSPAGELSWVLETITKNALPPSDVAVLARTRRVAQEFADHLRALGMPVKERRTPSLPSDWKWTKALVACVANPENETLAQNALAIRNGANAAAKLRTLATARSERLCEAFASHASLVRTHKEPTTLIDWLDGVGCTDPSLSRVRVALEAVVAQMGENFSVSDVLMELADVDQELQDVGSGVHVGTIHSAKGLEWGTVFVVGCEEGSLPSSKAFDIEEERRLFFVAVTRAKRQLYVSWCTQRPSFRRPGQPPGPPQQRRVSRFIGEAGL